MAHNLSARRDFATASQDITGTQMIYNEVVLLTTNVRLMAIARTLKFVSKLRKIPENVLIHVVNCNADRILYVLELIIRHIAYVLRDTLVIQSMSKLDAIYNKETPMKKNVTRILIA